jgi:hypothetical protein
VNSNFTINTLKILGETIMRNYETKVYDYVDKKTGAHVVKATTMYAGKTVSAFGKCDPSDNFDFNFGEQLAMKRLDLKIAQKRQASMLAYAKFCKMNLEFIDTTRRRTKTAMERAEVAALDRKLEVKQLEAEIVEMTANI